MAVRLKSNIGYQPIVEEVSRKFVPKKETCKAGGKAGPVVVESNGWMGGAVRTTNRGVLGKCSRNYLVIRANARQSVVSNAELAARARFVEVLRGRKHIMADLTQIVDVEEKWMVARKDATKACNGVSTEGYTLMGWVFAVQYAGLKNDPANYDVEKFPTKFDGE